MPRPLSLRGQGHKRGGRPWNSPCGGTVSCPCLFSWMSGSGSHRSHRQSSHTWPTVSQCPIPFSVLPTLPRFLVCVMAVGGTGGC